MIMRRIQQMQSFFQQKQSLKLSLSVCAFFILLGIVFFYLTTWGSLKNVEKDVLLKSFNSLVFSDADEGGKSKVHKITERIFSFNLDEKHEYSYAGLSYRIGTTEQEKVPCWDFSDEDSLRLVLRAHKSTALTITMIDKLPVGSNQINKEPFRLLDKVVPVSQKFTSQTLALEEWTIPEWWKKQHHLDLGGLPKFRNQVCRIDVVSSSHSPVGVVDTVYIDGIYTVKKNEFGQACSAILVFLGFFMGLAHFILLKYLGKMKSHIYLSLAEKIQNPSLHEEIEDERWIHLHHWIMTHYSQEEVSLKVISEALKIPERKISELCKVNMNLSFKELITTIRMNEAERLLKESDLQIQQISMSVGFGHISHFNRLFKEKKGCSPREFRVAFLAMKKN
jgi:AraC-like DNA-binding protein